MRMSELIAAYGDDNVKFQNLDQSSIDLNYDHKKGTTILFGTDQQIDLKGTKQLGLILWFDRDRINEIMSAPPQAQEE